MQMIRIMFVILLASPAMAQQPIKSQGGTAPDGYKASGGYFVPKNDKAKMVVPRIKGKPCPDGFYGSGDGCLSYK